MGGDEDVCGPQKFRVWGLGFRWFPNSQDIYFCWSDRIVFFVLFSGGGGVPLTVHGTV